MGVTDFFNRKKKKKGDIGPSPNPLSAEIAVFGISTGVEELQESQNVPDIAQNIELTAASEPPTKSVSQSPQSSIWIAAYAKLKEEDNNLVERYERFLQKLIQDDSLEEDVIEETPSNINRPVQMQSMDKAIQIGLRRTEKEAKLKGRFGEMARLIKIVKPVVTRAAKPSPEAALVWSCFTFGLEVLSNPVTEFEEQRRGVEYVISRLNWYLYLSESVLCEGKTVAGLQESLLSNLTALYKDLLGFMLKSICLYHQSRFLVTMRDLFKYDNWESQVKSIKDNEDAVERDLDQYHDTEFRKGLEAISTTATGIWEELKKWRDEEKDEICRMVIAKTIPFFTKASLLKQKGGLVPECCDWLFASDTFKRWNNEPDNRVMWISGAAGKGKTMLLCSIAEWFQYSRCVAYFFCKETDERLNNEAAILRGLIYSITEKTPALLKHARDNIGGLRQDGADGTEALYKTLGSILADPLTSDAVIMIDALDECTQNDNDEDEAPGGILRLIAELATNSSAKWVISSRNTLSAVSIQLGSMPGFLHLSLEDSTHSVSGAVAIFVQKKVITLCKYVQMDSRSQNDIVDQLILGADDTFLWVSLVLSDILKTLRNKRVPDSVHFILKQIQETPKSLDAIYWKVLRRTISESSPEDGIDVKDVLKIVYLAYRPLTVQELQYLMEHTDIRRQDDSNELRYLFNQASAFLTIEDNVVSFIHQSAKDFITKHGSNAEISVLPKDTILAHRELFNRSMSNISELKENIFSIEHPGTKMSELIRPHCDPLVPVGYSCTHWAYHLLLSKSSLDTEIQQKVYIFLSKHLLRWMEALAWIEELPAGEELLDKVKEWVPDSDQYDLQSWANDAYRFYAKFCPVVMETPLQVYASALVFAPLTSLVRQGHQSPKGIAHISGISETWDPCCVTIERPDYVFHDWYWHNNHGIVSFVSDGSRSRFLAHWSTKIGSCIRRTSNAGFFWTPSKSGQSFASLGYNVFQVWNAATGSLRSYDPEFAIDTVALSINGKYLLATSAEPLCLHIWDMTKPPGEAEPVSRERKDVLGDFRPEVAFITETLFVLALKKTIDVEDVDGKRWHRLKADHNIIKLSTCSGESTRFVTVDELHMFQIWDAISGECLGTFNHITNASVGIGWQVTADGSMFAFANNPLPKRSDFRREHSGSKSESSIKESSNLGYESRSSVVELCHLPPSTPTASLEIDCGGPVYGLAFSNNNRMLASALHDKPEITIWDTVYGNRLMVLRGHTLPIKWLSFSPDSCQLASSTDNSVKIWEIPAVDTGTVDKSIHQTGTMELSGICFSPDGQSLCTVNPSSVPQRWSNRGPEPLVSQDHKPWNRNLIPTSRICFSLDSSKFGFVLQTKAIEVWGVLNDEYFQICALRAEVLGWSEIRSISFSNEGGQMAMDSSISLAVWSLAHHTCVSVLDFEKFDIRPSLSRITKFLEDDHHLISSGDSGCFVISDVDGKCHRTFKGHASWIRALEVTSQRLISSADGEVKIWDIRNLNEITLINSIDIGKDTSLYLWNPGNNSLLYTNLGVLDLRQPTRQSNNALGTSMPIQFRGHGITQDMKWITKDGKQILWLPEEYRPWLVDRYASIWGSMIAIAGNAGPLVIHFSED